jgi:hypothetical protein
MLVYYYTSLDCEGKLVCIYLISNFRRVLKVVCFFFGGGGGVVIPWRLTPGNYQEESIQ